LGSKRQPSLIMKLYSLAAIAMMAAVSSASAQTVNDVVNLSARGVVGPISGNLSTGFIIQGAAPKALLIRGVGPGLAQFGYTDESAGVSITVYDQYGNVVASNNGYETAGNAADIENAASALGAFPLAQGGDSAILTTLAPGTYTLEASPASPGQADGVALAEVYDADLLTGASTSTLIANFSACGAIGQGDGALTLGFVIGGTSAENIYFHGLGPDLAAYGIPNPASAVGFSLYDGNGNLIESSSSPASGSDSVGLQSVASSVGDIAATNPSDSAMLVPLAPGAYSVVISDTSDPATDVALIEGYNVTSMPPSSN